MVTILSIIMNDDFVWLDSEFDTKEKIQFLEYKDGFMLSPKCVIGETLTPGVYEVNMVREGFFYRKKNLFVDDYVDIFNQELSDMVKEIGFFTESASLFEQFGVIHKRGVLLHGQPGVGKTAIFNQIMLTLTKKDYLVFLVDDPSNLIGTIEGLLELKKVLPSQPLAIFVEELDRFVNQAELEILQLLDGNNTMQPMLFFATTNNIEELSAAILRPSRIDLVIEVSSLSNEQRHSFLKAKNLPLEDVDKWVKDTDGFTIAMLKELMLSVLVLKKDYVKVIDIIKKRESIGKRYKATNKMGFK